MTSQLEDSNSPGNGLFSRVMRNIWHFFCSIKLAVILILIISGLSLVGALMGSAAMFNSLWFFLAGLLLVINIIVCTLNRWPGIRRSLNGGEVRQKTGFFASKESVVEIVTTPLSNDEVNLAMGRALAKHNYRVRFQQDENRVWVAADKNRYFRLGTFASHLSLILFILAYMAGNYFGFSDTIAVAEGSRVEIGHDSGLSLKLNSFEDEYYEDKTPKDFRSDVSLYKGDNQLEKVVVRVNHPLVYNDIRIYQSYFGPAVTMEINNNGTNIFSNNVPLSSIVNYDSNRRPAGKLALKGTGLTLNIVGPDVNGKDEVIGVGQVALQVIKGDSQPENLVLAKNVSQKIGEYEITYKGDAQFSGFQISKDPANIVIWIAAALFILGSAAVMYFPYRQVWALYEKQSDKKWHILLRLGSSRRPGNSSEAGNMAAEIEAILGRMGTNK
jgi:cytochrome c biogenesis protein